MFLLNSSASNTEERLIIGIAGVKTNERSFRIGKNILQEISKRMNVEIQLISLPAERALIMLREGEIHAEFTRVAAYKKNFLLQLKWRNQLRHSPIMHILYQKTLWSRAGTA